MKVLQLVSGRKLNGAIVHCLNLSGELTRRGHQVYIGNRVEGGLDSHALGVNANFEPFSCTFKRYPWELRRVANFVREQKIDLLHTHMSSAHFTGVLLKTLFGIPVVATAHSTRFQPHWRWNDRVIAVSESVSAYHQKVNWVPENRIDTIHAFIDTEKFTRVTDAQIASQRAAWNATDNQPCIGVVGDIIHRKGQLKLIQALPTILKQHPGAKVILIGPRGHDEGGSFHEDYAADIQRATKKFNLTEHVIWNGYAKDIAPVMRSLDLCVTPSQKEPFGLVAAEAMAAGCPVVASRVGGLVDIVEHEHTGLLTPPNTVEPLAEAIVRMLSDDQFQRECVTNGRISILKKFNKANQVAAIESVYEKVLMACGREKKNELHPGVCIDS